MFSVSSVEFVLSVTVDTLWYLARGNKRTVFEPHHFVEIVVTANGASIRHERSSIVPSA